MLRRDLDAHMLAVADSFKALRKDSLLHSSPPDTNTEDMSTLLQLPAHVRQSIFSKVVVDAPIADLSLLRVSRQVYQEAKPLIFRRPLVFHTQNDLYQWLERIDPKWLDLVVSLHIGITDVLPGRELGIQLGITPTGDNWAPYKDDADKSLKACLMLPNVNDFSLEPLFEVVTEEQSQYLQLLLSNIPIQWPDLEKVRFGSTGQKLNFLKGMPDLRSIAATGFSGSTPMETVAILSRLRHLENLELEWPLKAIISPSDHDYLDLNRECIKNQSFTRETIKGFRGLKSIKIFERKTDTAQSSKFVTTGFLQALDSSHRISLRAFEANIDFVPTISAQRTLHNLLSFSSLKHIDLLWPGFNEQVLDFLPSTLQSLRIPPCPPGLEPYCLLELAAKKDALPEFKRMSVARSKDLDTDGILATMQFQAAMIALMSAGVRVAIET